MKILVAIANYGYKNQVYLNTLINEYKKMEHDVHIVVLSNVPKNLGEDIEVSVGTPSKNPWYLPFVHKKIFADRISCYDLFIYSEDDTLITESNIIAFVQATKILPKHIIAGFLRFELDADGKKYCSTIHSFYHWDPNSVIRFGDRVFAFFSNEHSACYILNCEQLKSVIESGGFLVEPHEGKYDLLCTAATDPYTQCGLRKMICISHITDYMVHHLPNCYIGKMGISIDELNIQINKLLTLQEKSESIKQLFYTAKDLPLGIYDKHYFEKCNMQLISLIPKNVKRILSVGCGWGETESYLMKKGYEIVAIPIDPVIAELAAHRGIVITPEDFNESLITLSGQKFDCILLSEILHHLEKPVGIMLKYKNLLNEDGVIVGSVVNFQNLSERRKLHKYKVKYRCTNNYHNYQIHFTTKRTIRNWLEQSGFIDIRFVMSPTEKKLRIFSLLTIGLMNKCISTRLFFKAKVQAKT